ncbi:hypothetical protein [Paenibacillus xerothermodurans]|uniref:Uncharacterized protein n=1 Tax=Paenibacillus xerothermodurans TaxID=1977292 RepID=A0A2W1N3N9_PAEXE|nr:hypothetical protein [Paenibacillus xerothermodurans]PZE19349.1 hypothetical protein CBW46_019270 [Paenibacillus xerothermodurans]
MGQDHPTLFFLPTYKNKHKRTYDKKIIPNAKCGVNKAPANRNVMTDAIKANNIILVTMEIVAIIADKNKIQSYPLTPSTFNSKNINIDATIPQEKKATLKKLATFPVGNTMPLLS